MVLRTSTGSEIDCFLPPLLFARAGNTTLNLVTYSSPALGPQGESTHNTTAGIQQESSCSHKGATENAGCRPIHPLWLHCCCCWDLSHIQSTTLVDPWPTSRIWLVRQSHTATPAPALQWDTGPTSSHLERQERTDTKSTGSQLGAVLKDSKFPEGKAFPNVTLVTGFPPPSQACFPQLPFSTIHHSKWKSLEISNAIRFKYELFCLA